MANEQYLLKETLENKKLNGLLNDVRVDPSEENMLALLREAAVSRFIVPLIISDDGKPVIQGMGNSKGQQFMVVFADTKSYEVKADGAPLYGVLTDFTELVGVCSENPNMEGFVINPGLEEVLFGRDMLTMIADMMRGDDDTATVGDPDHYPPKLHDMLDEFLKVEPSVSRIWVRLMRVSKTNAVQWLFILDGDYAEKKDYIHETFSNFIRPYLDGLDLMCVSSDEEFTADITKGVDPYIERR
ncbi:SseB protein C-terminal domain-containing protein [Ruminococcaceae bacterium YRB3002]|nr:SseB protein C-terminal domain-containing protein [Ruminococcaceae bacterium YRB3002]